MEKLSQNWFIEGSIDAEFKKYLLLAYLQQVEENFENFKLYPNLAELISHYRNLVSFKESKNLVQQNFPEVLTDMDAQQFKLIYEKVVSDDELMQEIMNIVNQSMKLMKHALDQGKDIYETLESRIKIEPVGIVPIYKYDGYLFLKTYNSKTTKVYQYHIAAFAQNTQEYRSINTQWVGDYEYSLTTHFEFIKQDLVKKNKFLPNPAAFAAHADMEIPILESLLPIVKRKIIQYI